MPQLLDASQLTLKPLPKVYLIHQLPSATRKDEATSVYDLGGRQVQRLRYHPLPGTSDEVRPHGAVGSGEDVAGEQHPVRGSGDPPLPRFTGQSEIMGERFPGDGETPFLK